MKAFTTFSTFAFENLRKLHPNFQKWCDSKLQAVEGDIVSFSADDVLLSRLIKPLLLVWSSERRWHKK